MTPEGLARRAHTPRVESLFVGRVVEIEAIAEVMRGAARERHAAAVAIVGEPGSGKSRLI